jgi:pyruvate dehydrogenase E1 component alpha subunit|tara:strand:+ start:1958 stop:2569 length:612 start_codon:yes stop_codon:yes gene_type:complete
MLPKDLISFEEEIAESFNNAEIRAPIHLYNGNEEKIIDIFKNVKKEDYVFCTWRSHYQCLLKGVPRDVLKKDILDGKSITLCYPEYNIFSSAIVTGSISIANGRALAEKLKGSNSHVWCFVGEMSSETGAFHENVKYSTTHNLPITWVIEDNGKSVCTDTRETWNMKNLSYEEFDLLNSRGNVIYYKYDTKYPHAGAGKRIQF